MTSVRRDIKLNTMRKYAKDAIGLVKGKPVILSCKTTYVGNNIYWNVEISEIIQEQLTFQGDMEVMPDELDHAWYFSKVMAFRVFKKVARRYGLKILDERISWEDAAKRLGFEKDDLDCCKTLYKKVLI